MQHKGYQPANETLITLHDDEQKDTAILALRWSPALGLLPFALSYESVAGQHLDGVAAIPEVQRMLYESCFDPHDLVWVCEVEHIGKKYRLPLDLQRIAQVQLELDDWNPNIVPDTRDCTCIQPQEEVN